MSTYYSEGVYQGASVGERKRSPSLGTQLYLNSQPRILQGDLLLPVPYSARPSVKPDHDSCLWTSSYIEGEGSGWARWCMDEGFRLPAGGQWPTAYLLEPPPPARVYTIDSYADLKELIEAYGHHDLQPPYNYLSRDCPNWFEIAKAFDGVHLTDKGQWDTRLSEPYSLYGWGCESTVWFRWCFDSVKDIAPVSFRVRDDD